MRALRSRVRLAMHLERTIDEVCDPVLPDARPSVQASFDTVEPQAGLGDLDDESSGRRMRADVVKGNTSHDGYVGFRFRVVVEGQRRTQARVPSGSEGRCDDLADEAHRRGMGT